MSTVWRTNGIPKRPVKPDVKAARPEARTRETVEREVIRAEVTREINKLGKEPGQPGCNGSSLLTVF